MKLGERLDVRVSWLRAIAPMSININTSGLFGCKIQEMTGESFRALAANADASDAQYEAAPSRQRSPNLCVCVSQLAHFRLCTACSHVRRKRDRDVVMPSLASVRQTVEPARLLRSTMPLQMPERGTWKRRESGFKTLVRLGKTLFAEPLRSVENKGFGDFSFMPCQ